MISDAFDGEMTEFIIVIRGTYLPTYFKCGLGGLRRSLLVKLFLYSGSGEVVSSCCDSEVVI